MKYLMLLILCFSFCLSANAQVDAQQADEASPESGDRIALAKKNQKMVEDHWTKVQKEMKLSKKVCDYLENLELQYAKAIAAGDRLRQRQLEKEKGKYLDEILPEKAMRIKYQELSSEYQKMSKKMLDHRGAPRLRQE